ncbi:helix-turn-helix domain-containing protein, partial [Amycolatopsis sp. NPDC051061]|uniref:TetR/AcrR family transcriptional regulator n=1 Tax=Amycolatopsis sp. NPDC051061 TaxID=3155042 RepID=UPI003439324A
MARWQPNASERLVVAALDLFEERGYENTTVIEIAERAGLTKSTFFRHFPDKREVLFGGDAMAGLLAAGIADAPTAATPLDAVVHALDALGREAFTAERRAFATRRRAVISAHPELREREALKGLGLTAAMAEALERRGVPDPASRVAAQLGALVMTIAYERWSDPGGGRAGGGGGRRRRAPQDGPPPDDKHKHFFCV